MPIPIIDLFAGPGGLGEGFSSCVDARTNERTFKIAVSVEKDPFAHRTLSLRAFVRQYPLGAAPDAYYDYLKKQSSREDLFGGNPRQAAAADDEALLRTLGTKDNEEIHSRIERAVGFGESPWLLIGGPPCQAYSLVGRARMVGSSSNSDFESKRKEFEKDPRHKLYLQYLEIIARFRPTVFVMENVKGLLSAKLDGQPVIDQILTDLQDPRAALRSTDIEYKGSDPHYRVVSLVTDGNGKQFKPDDYLIRMEQFGIPQMRHRVILLGIRSDIKAQPELLKRVKNQVCVKEVISDLPKVRSSVSNRVRDRDWHSAVQRFSYSPDVLKLDIDDIAGAISKAQVDCQQHMTTGGEWCGIKTNIEDEALSAWFNDPRLEGVLNHSTRSHIPEDLHRYLYASSVALETQTSPKLGSFPKSLLPAHKNVNQDKLIFDDRFRVQVWGKPATTVTCHISKDGHYYIHPDPSQCRSLTVREAARIQTFPDNYFFEGPRTEQYKQVGNAVPPMLAWKIAKIVQRLFV
jgi:DNA (cytosine-5)-methyltransferase 1